MVVCPPPGRHGWKVDYIAIRHGLALRPHAFHVRRIDGARPTEAFGNAGTKARIIRLDPRTMPAPDFVALQDAEDPRPSGRIAGIDLDRTMIREGRFQPNTCLRREPVGPVSGCRRERLLRIHLPALGHRRLLLRRAIRKRRQLGFDHYEEHETRDGRRVQPGTFNESVYRSVPNHCLGLLAWWITQLRTTP